MVKYPLDRTFQALADPTRRAIVTQLAEHETAISALATPFHLTLPAVSKHIDVLESAHLVVRHKRGRTTYCRLVAEPLAQAGEWLAQQGATTAGRIFDLNL
jgi:DNA-binding transcriptional ArsR family regulator